jgi:hypothetical protein
MARLRLSHGFGVDARDTRFRVSAFGGGVSNIILSRPIVDAEGAVVNPDPTGTAEITLATVMLLAVGSVENPNPTGTSTIDLTVPTVDASGIGGSPTLLSVDFTTQSVSPLTFERSGSGYSVQDSETTLLLSGGFTSSNVARFGRHLAALPLMLVFEETRANRTRQSSAYDQSGWDFNGGNGATRTSGQTGPDGAASAWTLTSISGQWCIGESTGTGTAASQTFSAWHKAPSGSAGTGLVAYRMSDFVRSPCNTAVTTAWKRIHGLAANSLGSGFGVTVCDGRDFSASGGLTAGARNFDTFGVQREDGLFPTEHIPTTTAAVTRNGERLFYATASTLLASDASHRPYYDLYPKGSSGQYLADMRLWYYDANNHAEVVFSTGAVKITIAGSAYTTPVAMTWAADDHVEIWLPAGGGSVATEVKYRVNGGSWTILSTGSPPTQADVPFSTSALDVLCGPGATQQFTARVKTYEVYEAGSAPAGA